MCWSGSYGFCLDCLAELHGESAGHARALSGGVLFTYLVEVAVVLAQRRGGVLIRFGLDAFRHTAICAGCGLDIIGLNNSYGLLPRASHLAACAGGPHKVKET